MDEAVIIIRPYDKDTDDRFIFPTWRNALYYSPATPSQLSPDDWFKTQSRIIKKILKSATIRIACLEDNPIQIVGYAIVLQECLEFVYVKEDYRRHGIAKLLLKRGFDTVTPNLTRTGLHLVRVKKLKIKGEKNATEERSPDHTGPSPVL